MKEISIITYLDSCKNKSIRLLNSLKLSKNDITNYSVYLLGQQKDLDSVKDEISKLIGNDFKLCYIVTQTESKIQALSEFLKNSSIDYCFYLNDIIVYKDLSDLNTYKSFGSMLVKANCCICDKKVARKVGAEFIYKSNFMYLNANRLRIEGMFEEIEKYCQECDDDIALNMSLSGRILLFDKPVINYCEESISTYNKYHKSQYTDENILKNDCYSCNQNKEYLLNCVDNRFDIRQCNLVRKQDLNNLKQLCKDSIVFGFDHNNVDQFITAGASLLDVISNKCHIICLIRNDVTPDDRYKILYYLSLQFENKFVISFISVDECLSDVYNKTLFEVRGITSIVYARMFIPFLFKNFKSIMYSDCDVLFRKDPFIELDKVVKNGALIYGVPSIRLKGRNNSSLYINSGFLYYDLSVPGSRDNSLKLMLEEHLKTNYLFQDQDIINLVYEGKKEKLSPSFCMIPKCYVGGVYNLPNSKKLFTRYELEDLKDSIIVHWAGVEKPWSEYCPPKSSEWKSVKESVFSGNKISYESEKIFVKQNFIQSVATKVTRKFISDIIGEVNMIPKMASYPIGIVMISKLPESFILRTNDYKKKLVCKSKIEYTENLLSQDLQKFNGNRQPIFVEKYIPNTESIFVTNTKNGIELNTNGSYRLNSDVKQHIIELSKKLYTKLNADKQLEFVIDQTNKVYFSSIN